MNVGLTYDLRADYLAAGYGEEETAEFDRPDTIDAIERALQELGHTTVRVGNIRQLVPRLAAGERWDLVFNIAEGLRGIGREAQVPALLDAYEIPYTFSDPLVAALTLHKGMTKRVLRDLRIPTAAFAVVEEQADIQKVNLSYPLFVKPVAEGTAKGISERSKVNDPEQLRTECLRLLAEFRQPVLVETYLPGREFTVGITGSGDQAAVVAVMEVIFLATAEAHGYTYLNKEQCEQRCQYVLADAQSTAEAKALSLATWRGLNCRDGGRVDLRADADGRLQVMEVNPLPGLHPEHSDLPILSTMVGLPYRELIGRIVNSAIRRIDTGARRP